MIYLNIALQKVLKAEFGIYLSFLVIMTLSSLTHIPNLSFAFALSNKIIISF